jgi:hypothetical protein
MDKPKLVKFECQSLPFSFWSNYDQTTHRYKGEYVNAKRWIKVDGRANLARALKGDLEKQAGANNRTSARIGLDKQLLAEIDDINDVYIKAERHQSGIETAFRADAAGMPIRDRDSIRLDLNLLLGTNMQKLCVPVVFALMALISGCATTMVPVLDTNAAPLRLSIAVGDTVRVLTKYGDRPTFKVLDITEIALIGKDQSIRYDDMAFVEKKSRKADAESVLAVSLVLALGAVAVDGFGRIAPGFPSAQ